MKIAIILHNACNLQKFSSHFIYILVSTICIYPSLYASYSISIWICENFSIAIPTATVSAMKFRDNRQQWPCKLPFEAAKGMCITSRKNWKIFQAMRKKSAKNRKGVVDCSNVPYVSAHMPSPITAFLCYAVLVCFVLKLNAKIVKRI